MTSRNAIQKIIKQSATIQRGAEVVRQEIFGHKPQLNLPSGGKTANQTFVGPFVEKYYPESINKYARLVKPGWETDQEEYRRVKLTQRRRKGKGPPQKGSGSRSKKKK